MTGADWASIIVSAVSIAAMVAVYLYNRRANQRQLERWRP